MARKPPKGKSLAEVNPELASLWHPQKNGLLKPIDIMIGSRTKIWWSCTTTHIFDWQERCRDVIRREIFCRKCHVESTSIAKTNIKMLKDWHPNKNIELMPLDISSSSNKKVWWKCDKADDHEWITSPNAKRGCPMCIGQKIVKSNCLATTHPEITKQWHPSKNNKISPEKVGKGSKKKVWWICDKGDDHEWEMLINPRTHATNPQGCPICSNKKVVKSNCLATTHPKIAKQWHPTKNGELTPCKVVAGSHKKVWWICDKGDDHEWQAVIKNRAISGHNCGVCGGKALVKSNSLTSTHPDIAEQWHPTKNGDLTPDLVITGSNQNAWWKCNVADDHVWNTRVADRIGGHNCPMCTGNIVVKSNSLATLNPDLSKQWHPKKNGNLTPEDVVLHSGKKVWWKCNRGDDHEWLAQISNRNVTECPYCTLTPQSRQELTITFELIKFFKEINPKGFKTRVKGKLWSIDIYIPQLKLGIEFDGSYWHKDKRALDKLKTENLEEEGFEIFRVRE